MNDLAGKEDWQEKQDELRALLKTEMKAQGDFWDLDKEFWGHSKERMSWKDRTALNP